MTNRNVQLKLNDIWQKKQLPSTSSPMTSSESLNVTSKTTYKVSGQGDDVQGKGSGQGDSSQGNDVQGKGNGQGDLSQCDDVQGKGSGQGDSSQGNDVQGKGNGQGDLSQCDDVQGKGSGQGDSSQCDDVEEKGNKQVEDGELSKDNAQNKDLIQRERDRPIQDDKQDKGHIDYEDNEQNENFIQLDGSESENEINMTNVCKELCNNYSDSMHDHNHSSSVIKKQKKLSSGFSKRRKNYLIEWEKRTEAQYKTYTIDRYGIRQEKYLCWLYFNGTSMHCSLCEKYAKKKNLNGKENVWCTSGMTIFSLDMIKRHKEENGVHKQAGQEEITVSDGTQPDWIKTQKKIIDKYEQAIQNLMLSCIYLCQQDQPLNDIEPLSALLEKVGVMLLPAETPGINYRNDTAALSFTQHIAICLHSELVEKIKKSPTIGWMMDETTSRSVEKSFIIYVRYIENFEPKTSFYGLIGLNGDGSAQNIVNSLVRLWEQDDINPINTCWIASDNAATFTGVHEGVVAKLKQRYSIEFVESSPCMAHSFALVGSQAAYISRAQNGQKAARAPCVEKLESTIGDIYTYFSRSSGRQFDLKSWQEFMEIPEMKFKRIFDIRWSSIRGCIKPIIDNIQPGSQALLTCLEQTTLDTKSSNMDKKSAKKLLDLVLDDEFLFHLHMHHDLHESILGPVTKFLQQDYLSYFTLMDIVQEKKTILNHWASESASSIGPTLTDYVETTKLGSFDRFKINLGDRNTFFNDARKHIKRLLQELDKRFKPSVVQENLSLLFDVPYLIKNQNKLDSTEYGRRSLDILRKKYKTLPNFDYNLVRNEWESFKPIVLDYIQSFSSYPSQKLFWKNLISLKQSTNNDFIEEYKNILLLLNVYLISPTNSAECERGFSAMNRIQTIGRGRLSISTLNHLLTIRLLLKDDLRSVRCQQIVEKAFLLWNDDDHSRRLRRVQLLIDVPRDYQPMRQVRSVAKRNLSIMNLKEICKKPKKSRSLTIKCANECDADISQNDPTEQGAIQCYHQNDRFDWIENKYNCSRWLCNGCQIKLDIKKDSVWICSEHIHMHIDTNEDEYEDETE